MFEETLSSQKYLEKTGKCRLIQKYISDGEYEAEFSVYKYNNVILFNNAVVLTEDNYPIEDSFRKHSFENQITQILERSLIPLLELNDIEYVSLLGSWAHNYWHWLFDFLPNVIISEKMGFIGKYIIRADRFIIQKMTSLVLLGIGSNRILVQDQDASFSINNFSLVEKIPHTDERFLLILKIIRDSFLSKVSENKVKNRKIYISRQKIKETDKNSANGRYIVNEDEVWKLLESYGFEKIYMEDYTLDQQIKIASESNFIIGGHGSGIAHSLFMQEKSHIIEFFSPNYINHCSSKLPTKLLNHDYRMLITEHCEEYSYGKSHDAPILVPIDYLEIILDNIFLD